MKLVAALASVLLAAVACGLAAGPAGAKSTAKKLTLEHEGTPLAVGSDPGLSVFLDVEGEACGSGGDVLLLNNGAATDKLLAQDRESENELGCAGSGPIVAQGGRAHEALVSAKRTFTVKFDPALYIETEYCAGICDISGHCVYETKSITADFEKPENPDSENPDVKLKLNKAHSSKPCAKTITALAELRFEETVEPKYS
jgi:hypothetical protein